MPPAKKKPEKAEPAKVQAPPKPNWPAFSPQPYAEELDFIEVVPGQIRTTQLWTPSQCKKYVTFLQTLPLVTTPAGHKRDEAARVNDRYQVDDPAFAERLWSETGLKDLVMNYGIEDGVDASEQANKLWGGMPVGLNPNIRIYRYSPGQFFDQHYDATNLLTHPGPPSTPAKTTWTLLLYLTSPVEGCLGGETVFYPEPTKKKGPAPEPVITHLVTGNALLHKQGKDCMLHEGREVTQGEKWVIRSDLCVKR